MSNLSMNQLATNPMNTNCSTYTETLNDYGKTYVVSIHPKHVVFMDNMAPPDVESRYPYVRNIKDRVVRIFYIGDETKNRVEKAYTARTFDYVKAPTKEHFINNLNKPDYQELFEAIDTKKPSKIFSKTSVLVQSDLTFFNYINYSDVFIEHVNCIKRHYGAELLTQYESLLNNSEDTPLVLRMNEDKGLYTCEFLDYVAVTEFNDGDVFFNFNMRGYAFNQRKNTFFKYMDDRYSLKLRKDKPSSLTKNGRLMYGTHPIINMFLSTITNSWICEGVTGSDSEVKREKTVFLKLIEKHFFKQSLAGFLDGKSFEQRDVARSCYELYRVYRNQQLSDLPWNTNELRSLYNTYFTCRTVDDYKKFRLARNNINRYLRKGDTKRATEFGYYGFKFPKAIKKLLLKIPPLSLSYDCVKMLFDIYQKEGTNNTINIMKDDAGEIDLYWISKPPFLEAILLGFSKNRLISVGYNTLIDTMFMRSALIDRNINTHYQTNNFVEYHDYLSALYTAIMKSESGAHTTAFKIVDTSDQLPSMIVNGFTIRSPNSTSELIDVGSDMRHCVASYCHSYYYRELDILLIEKDEKYIACIETNGNFVVQAKLKFNKPITDNEDAFEALKEWCYTNSYTMACGDCGTSRNRDLEQNEQNPNLDAQIKYRKSVVGRAKYIISIVDSYFKPAEKSILKSVLLPTWIAVLDNHCAINTKGIGLNIWGKFQVKQGRQTDNIPF